MSDPPGEAWRRVRLGAALDELESIPIDAGACSAHTVLAQVNATAAAGVITINREHFFALAATAMRQILVDYARRRKALKRGGPRGREESVRVEDAGLQVPDRATEVLAVHEALARLEALEPRLGRAVELPVFGGLAMEEIVSVLDVSERTIKRDWHKVRAFPYLELGGEDAP